VVGVGCRGSLWDVLQSIHLLVANHANIQTHLIRYRNQSQVSERAIHMGAALVGEGRHLLQEHAGATPEPQDQQRRSRQEQTGSSHQQHMSTAGLVRRKGDGADGVQMVGLGGGAGGLAAVAPKDE